MPRNLSMLGLAGLLVSLACAGNTQTEGAAHRAAVVVDPRVAAVTELEAARAALLAGIGHAEEGLRARDAAAASAALAPVKPAVESFRQRLGADGLGELGARYDAVAPGVEHLSTLHEGLQRARGVVADKKKCDTPLEISEAWSRLKVAVPADPEWKEAKSLTGKLEKCRVAVEKQLTVALRSLMVGQREDTARKLERIWLDGGMDVRVRLSGTHKDQLKMSWVLMSRVLAHQLTEGGSMAEGSFLSNMQKVGFRSVIFSDSYSEYWTYTLHPEDESAGGRMTLEPMGLGSPLKLSS